MITTDFETFPHTEKQIKISAHWSYIAILITQAQLHSKRLRVDIH